MKSAEPCVHLLLQVDDQTEKFRLRSKSSTTFSKAIIINNGCILPRCGTPQKRTGSILCPNIMLTLLCLQVDRNLNSAKEMTHDSRCHEHRSPRHSKQRDLFPDRSFAFNATHKHVSNYEQKKNRSGGLSATMALRKSRAGQCSACFARMTPPSGTLNLALEPLLVA